jgi:Insertion element 4 transposase N-terminal/Transposase DDE domain
LGAHAVMPAARPSSGCGVLSWFVPPALAGGVAREAAAERAAALAAAGEKVPRRRARLLPPWLAVYFTLALCLLARLPCQDALRSLAGDGGAGLGVPATTALTAARRRLGERPLELLFQRVAGVLLTSRDPWAAVCGLLVAAWDGTTLKVPASPENTIAFGRPRGGGKKPGGGKAPSAEGHYPHLRVVALIACGTRAPPGAAIGPFADGGQTLAAALTARLRPGMPLLADRAYRGHVLRAQCAAAGADLPWRVKSDIRLPVRQPLPDGSRLSVVNGTREAHRRAMRNANRRSRGSRLPQEEGPLPGDVTVRVIEFLITLTREDGTTRTERYRAVTTLLDWCRHPAADPAAAHARRWGIETAYREAK